MKLTDFKKAIDTAVKRAGKCAKTANVEVWLGERQLKLTSVNQFSIVPDVVIHLSKMGR